MNFFFHEAPPHFTKHRRSLRPSTAPTVFSASLGENSGFILDPNRRGRSYGPSAAAALLLTSSGKNLNFCRHWRQEKAVVVMGATGAGKSRLSIDLTTSFDAELINSDRIQAYPGLEILTDRVADDGCDGVTHHLLGTVDQMVAERLPEPNSKAAVAAATLFSTSLGENSGFILDLSRRSLGPSTATATAAAALFGFILDPNHGEVDILDPRRHPSTLKAMRYGGEAEGIVELGSAATFIEKWSVPYLTYEFDDDFPEAGKPAVLRAFKSWEEPLNFNFSFSFDGTADIYIGMFEGEHGDMCRFKDGELAHTFYPPHGEIHFNSQKPWWYELDPPPAGSRAFFDFQSAAVHEIGHVLGIRHSDNPKDVMYRFINHGEIRRGLTYADVAALKHIYAGDPNFD